MEPLTDQELRARKAYKRAIAIGVAAVVALTLWLIRPIPKADLRFINALSPVTTKQEQGSTTMVLAMPAKDVEALLDKHLVATHKWKKMSGGGVGSAMYEYQGRRSATIELNPRFAATPAFHVSGPKSPFVPPKPIGSTITIWDTNEILILK